MQTLICAWSIAMQSDTKPDNLDININHFFGHEHTGRAPRPMSDSTKTMNLNVTKTGWESTAPVELGLLESKCMVGIKRRKN